MSDNEKIGRDGSGCGTYSKYGAEGAPVAKHGANEAIHDGIQSEQGGTGAKIDELKPGFGK